MPNGTTTKKQAFDGSLLTKSAKVFIPKQIGRFAYEPSQLDFPG